MSRFCRNSEIFVVALDKREQAAGMWLAALSRDINGGFVREIVWRISRHLNRVERESVVAGMTTSGDAFTDFAKRARA